MDAFVSLLALFSLCYVLAAKGKILSGVTPLLAVCGTMLYFSLAGIFNILPMAGYLYYVIAFGALAYVLLIDKIKTLPSSPGFVFFAFFSVLALVYLGIRQPIFSEWDEFSFWGTASKLMKLHDELYSTAPTGWFWTSTEMPGLVVLGYFTQFLGPVFSPWKVFFAYDLLFFACFAAVLAPFSWREWTTVVPLATCCLLTPFFFRTLARTVHMSTVYINAYGDLPAGIVFGGVVAAYYSLRKTDSPFYLLSLIPLAAFTLVKENTFPVVLVAAAILAADTLFFCKDSKKEKAVAITGFFATPCVVYLVWRLYASWANAQNIVIQGEQTGGSATSGLIDAVSQLFGLQPRSEKLTNTLAEMGAAFAGGDLFKVSMLGNSLITMLLILFVFLLSVILLQEKKARLRVGLAAFLLTAGFAGFQLVLLTVYAFVTKYESGLPDYARYSSSYFSGWFLLSVYFLALSAQNQKPVSSLAARGGLWAGSIGMLVLFSRMVLPGYSVLDYNDVVYAPLRAEQTKAEQLAAAIEPGGRTFFVSQGDDGQKWFRYHYYLQPSILDYSEGGGTFGPPIEEPPDLYHSFTLEQLQFYLEEHRCQYIIIEQLDDIFIETYAPLFSDGLSSFAGESILYYKDNSGYYIPYV